MKGTIPYKQFISSFEKLAYRHAYNKVFDDFLDFALFLLNIEKNDADFEIIERFDKTYNKEEAEEMGIMFNCWRDLSDNNGNGFYDALGDLFMATCSQGRVGQYFTDQHITDFMAKCLGGIMGNKNETMLEPSCGSGRMLLSAASNHRFTLMFGCDIDETCCKMATLNLLINILVGEIAHYNPLSNEFYKSWHIGKGKVNGVWCPIYYTSNDFTKSKFSRISEQERTQITNKIISKQQTLF